MTAEHAPGEGIFACGSHKFDGIERISHHCNTRVALRDALAALKDLADAAAPIVADKPATTRDYVELHDARKRALIVLEVAS
jgi:hypothetical protein